MSYQENKKSIDSVGGNTIAWNFDLERERRIKRKLELQGMPNDTHCKNCGTLFGQRYDCTTNSWVVVKRGNNGLCDICEEEL